MNRERLINRMNGVFDHGRETFHNMEGIMRKNAKTAARRAKKSIRQGRNTLVSMEENIADNIKRNPAAYILIGVGIISLLLAKVFIDQRRAEDEEF